VKDIFLFSCYTGLAYIDVYKLRRSDIVTGVDNGRWIITTRQKTDSATRLPLLPAALAIMEKYKDHPKCAVKDLTACIDQSKDELLPQGDRRYLQDQQEPDFSHRQAHFRYYRDFE